MCVDDVVRLGVERTGALERVQIFILAEGLKIEIFWALSGRESSLIQTFYESCAHLDITHRSVHMSQRFVIRGCPTLMTHSTTNQSSKLACKRQNNNIVQQYFQSCDLICI